MTIVPCSEVRILRGCKLKPDYKHTAWWISDTRQYNYFNGLTKYIVTDVQYVKTGELGIKVAIPIENLMDCNYLILTNKGHENKHYYAFITNIKYISESTTLIQYEIDLIQTWYFECELLPCLVEREHSVKDIIGENLLPEPVAIGDYSDYDSGYLMEEALDDQIVAVTCLSTSDTGKIQTINKKMIGRTYSGLHYHAFPTTTNGIEQLTALIGFETLNPFDNVVTIFMCPKLCYTNGTKVVNMERKTGSFGGHTPNNNKLYTFPYNFLRVTAGDCGYKDFKYEFFDDGKPKFTIKGDLSCEPAMLLVPESYRLDGAMIGVNGDFNDILMLTGYPQCSWGSDMYLAFLSQVAATAATVTGHIGQYSGADKTIAPSVTTGKPVVVQSDFGRATDLMTNLTNQFKVDHSVRNATNSTALFNKERLRFEYVVKRITGEYAKIIDDFFDKYGYACNKVKVPNRTSRPQWNYVKTADCCIAASLPSDIVIKIQDIYNNGITFWNYADNIGDYSLDNRPK